jgi:hypothetical protein
LMNMCIHCFDCSLVSPFINETQILSSVTYTMRLTDSTTSLWFLSKKSQSEANICVLRALISIFKIHIKQNLR